MSRLYQGDYNFNVQKSLVGHWPLNSTDGATDLINGNNGTLNGGMTYGSSGGREYAVFDGVNDYVSLPAGVLDFGTGDFSLAMWVNTSVVGQDTFVDNYASGTKSVAMYLSNGFFGTAGGIWLYTYDGTEHVRASSITINDGAWHHICGTRSGSTLNTYIDGVLSNGTQTGSGVKNVSTGGVANIGVQPGGANYYTGSAYDFRIYNRALSAAEIARLARIY